MESVEVYMALTRRGKMLSREQMDRVVTWIGETRRNPLRDTTVFYLSFYAGLRAKEISELRWEMLTDADGLMLNHMELTNAASKGHNGGRVIPLHPELRRCLDDLYRLRRKGEEHVVLSDERKPMKAKSVVVMFGRWYEHLEMKGCSSHSGRRTFITNTARLVGRHGGSLREVQDLAGHSSLWQTQTYIVVNEDAKRSVVAAL
jgi:integrase/recombinase XerD